MDIYDLSDEEFARFRRTQAEFRYYLALATLVTLLFLAITFVMCVTPGMYVSDKLHLLAIDTPPIVAILGLGIWRFRKDVLTVRAAPLWPAVGVILTLELAFCLFGVVSLLL